MSSFDISRFQVGQTYIATPCFEGARQKIVVVIGRKDGHLQLAGVKDLDEGKVMVFDGREMAQFDAPDGLRYSIHSTCPIDAVAGARAFRMMH